MIWMSKLKWIALSVFSLIMTGLAILYGKRTTQVVKAKLADVESRENVIKMELAADEARKKRLNGKANAKAHEEKVVKLETKLKRVQETKAKVLSESGSSRYTSDDDLALSDNRRSARSSSN